MKLTLLFVALLCGLFSISQTNSISEILSQDPIRTEKIKVENSSSTKLIPSKFSNDVLAQSFLDPDNLSVIKVYYIYTAYKRSATFDQKQLDLKRLTNLSKRFPFLFNDPMIEWEVIEQTGCTDYTVGDDFYHGFIIVHRPNDEASRKKEIERLLEVLNDPSKDFPEPQLDPVSPQLEGSISTDTPVNKKPDAPATYTDGDYALYQYFQRELHPKSIGEKREDLWVETDLAIDRFGRVGNISYDKDYPVYITDEISETLQTMGPWSPAQLGGSPVASNVKLSIRVSYSGAVNGMFTRDGNKPNFISDTNSTGLISREETEERESSAALSNTVYRGLNVLEKDTRYALVMDVTGSMAPNIAAMKRWIEKNASNMDFTSFSFYNDGDGKPTSQKKKGETGGIYMTTSVDEIGQVIEKAVLAGSGGEISEADIEALLYAIENDPDCEELLLIGDNYSDIRDLSLLKNVSKKVNVLLCAAPTSVRTEYLTLVKSTGGVFILNGVAYSLDKLQKGDRITLQSHVYLFNGTDFKLKEVLPKG